MLLCLACVFLTEPEVPQVWWEVWKAPVLNEKQMKIVDRLKTIKASSDEIVLVKGELKKAPFSLALTDGKVVTVKNPIWQDGGVSWNDNKGELGSLSITSGNVYGLIYHDKAVYSVESLGKNPAGTALVILKIDQRQFPKEK